LYQNGSLTFGPPQMSEFTENDPKQGTRESDVPHQRIVVVTRAVEPRVTKIVVNQHVSEPYRILPIMYVMTKQRKKAHRCGPEKARDPLPQPARLPTQPIPRRHAPELARRDKRRCLPGGSRVLESSAVGESWRRPASLVCMATGLQIL
jgi:hypothetical protein